MNPPLSSIEAFILVGGASRRLGRDKALLSLDGKLFIDRIAEALKLVSNRVRLVGSRQASSGESYENVPDRNPGWGALGGVETALAASESEWAAIVACDLPFVTGELMTRMASWRQNFDTVVPVQTDGRQQPLCALYRRDPCAELAQQLVKEGARRPRDLLTLVTTRWVAPTELADLAGAERFFHNVNTPEDYTRAMVR
ncbi:MAG: molybdenum cofactor guanylyltransferase [Pyrinomonadaceae bacterium]